MLNSLLQLRFCVTNEGVDGQSLSLAGNHTVLFLRHVTLDSCWRLVMIFPPAVFECVRITGRVTF